MLRTFLLALLTLVLALGFADEARAGLMTVAYDGFNYGNSTLNGQNGGFGWSGAWSNYGNETNFATSATGLTYPGLTTTNGSVVYQSSGNPIDADTRSLASGISSSNSSVAYIQFLSDWTSQSGGGTPELRFSYQGSQTGAFGNNGFSDNMAILGSNLHLTPNGATTSISMNQLDLVIVQINYVADTTSMWVNPNLGTFNYQSPTSPDATATGFAPAFDTFQLITQGGSFDELTVMADPIALPPASTPEPASIALMVAGIGGLVGSQLARRRRQAAVRRQLSPQAHS